MFRKIILYQPLWMEKHGQRLYTTDSQEVSETDWYTVEFPAVECRYVKIQFNSVVEACDLGYCAAIRELEFYGSLVSKDNIDLNVDMPGNTKRNQV